MATDVSDAWAKDPGGESMSSGTASGSLPSAAPGAAASGVAASDEVLVKAACGGDAAGFERLVERYFGMVYSIAYARLHQRESAEDLAQEVFHRVFLHLDCLREPRYFATWVGRIARNLAADWARRGQTQSRLIPMLPLEELPRELADRLSKNARKRLEEKEERGALHEALERLPPDLRELVLLHYAEEWTLNDIADGLGVHSTTVGRRIEKALRKMRAYLDPILRETAPRLAARTDAKVHTYGLIAATAALTPSSKAVLAAAALKGLPAASSLAAGAAGAFAGLGGSLAATPWGKTLLVLHFKLAAVWQKYQNLGIVPKFAVVLSSLVVVGGGVYGVHEATKSNRHLYYDRLDNSVVEVWEGDEGQMALRTLWPTPDLERTMIKEISYGVEEAGGNLITQMRMETNASLVFGFSMRVYSLMQPNPYGGYDLAGRLLDSRSGVKKPSEREELTEALRQWRKGEGGASEPVPDAWVPIEDRRVVDALQSVYAEPQATLEKILTLIEDNPDSPLLPLLAFDIAVMEEDEAEVRRLLERFEGDLYASPRPFFAAAPRHYHEWLKGMALDREGRNLASRIAYSPDPQFEDAPNPDLVGYHQALQSARYTDSFFVSQSPLLIQPVIGKGAVPSFLSMMVLAKVYRVFGEFRLFQGDPDGALDMMLPVHRLGVVLTRSDKSIIGAVIGGAIRANSTAGIRTAFLDGMRTPEEIERNWPRLEEAYRADLAVSKDFLFPEMYDILVQTQPDTPTEDQMEAITRNLVTHGKMALAHSAAAARFHLLTTGEYPANASDFGPLLPDGADPDPFEDFKKPLRIARRGDRPFVLYSLGPDREDQRGEFEYDPTNGTISPGDLFADIPRTRTYPFPPPGELATTRDGILAQFPNGLPPDPFANQRECGYTITDAEPAWIMSWGPDTDQREHGVDFADGEPLKTSGMTPEQREFFESAFCSGVMVAVEDPPGPGYGVSTSGGRYFRYPSLVPEVAYDPTNGVVSEGDLYFCSGAPAATMLENNLPPTPTPFAVGR